MPRYMCLLYADPVDEDTAAERMAEMPLWLEVTQSLQEAGVLVANAALHGVASATTLRAREGELTVTDGPFATTKETLGGYYLLECRDLDEALRHAARLPLLRYGSIEVRPVVSNEEVMRIAAEASGSA
jgi:hypothetical protein